MITARQSRAARALLGWTQETLADKARLSLTALKRLEIHQWPRGLYERTRDEARRALEAAGIVFLSTDRGRGCWSMIAETSRTDLQAYADLWAARFLIIRTASISDQTWLMQTGTAYSPSLHHDRTIPGPRAIGARSHRLRQIARQTIHALAGCGR